MGGEPTVAHERSASASLHLPEGVTMQLLAGEEVVFSSGRKWLHPLFDLEPFFASGPVRPAQTRLVDRITGRAAAFLVVRLGIPRLGTLVLSRRAIPVLQRFGVEHECGEVVDRVKCATEDLLAEVEDVEAAWSILQARRARALASK